MAFSTNPEMQTYETHQIPAVMDLVFFPGQTNAVFGPGMKNMVPVKLPDGSEAAETRMCINSRDVTSGADSFTCRGMHVWEKTAGTVYYFVVVNDTTALSTKVYTSTNASTWAAVTTLTNYGTTPVRFTEFIDATNTKKLVMVDGIEGYVFTSNAAGTQITDVDFPTPHIPFPVFIDGYLFLAKAGTADIYNSDLNDPAIWTAGSFISAEMFPDDIQATVKVNNYLVAIGTTSCEYFYDAANPTASPLSRLEGATHAFGTPFPNSIASTEDTLVFLANNNDGEASLRIINGTQSNQLPCPFLEILQAVLASTNQSDFRAWFFRQNNDLFYVFTTGANKTPNLGSSAGPTFAYSFGTEKWVEFTGNNPINNLGSDIFPVFYSDSTISSTTLTYIAGHGNKGDTTSHSQVFFGTFRLVNSGANDTFITTGNTTTNLTVFHEIRTTPQTYGTLNIKTQSRLGISCFKVSGGYTTVSFTVRWNDSASEYDFSSNGVPSNTVVTGSTSLAMDFPFITQMGAFRQRVYSLQTTPSAPIRINYIESTVNKGIR